MQILFMIFDYSDHMLDFRWFNLWENVWTYFLELIAGALLNYFCVSVFNVFQTLVIRLC